MKTGAILVAMVLICVVPASAHAQNAQTTAAQRADAAQHVAAALVAQYRAGTATLDDVAAWTARAYHAKRDAGITGAALAAAAQEWVDKMRAVERIAQQRVRTSLASSVEGEKAAYYRLEAEMTLAKLTALPTAVFGGLQ